MANKVIQKEEIDYENLIEEDLGEEVKFTFARDAFESEEIFCSKCKIKAKKTEVEISLPRSQLYVKLYVFRCPKCNKEYLNFKESEKLDRLLVLNNIIEKHGIGYVRSLNFDGDNMFIRFPVELTRGFDRDSKAEIRPLSMNEFLIRIEKTDNIKSK